MSMEMMINQLVDPQSVIIPDSLNSLDKRVHKIIDDDDFDSVTVAMDALEKQQRSLQILAAKRYRKRKRRMEKDRLSRAEIFTQRQADGWIPTTPDVVVARVKKYVSENFQSMRAASEFHGWRHNEFSSLVRRPDKGPRRVILLVGCDFDQWPGHWTVNADFIRHYTRQFWVRAEIENL